MKEISVEYHGRVFWVAFEDTGALAFCRIKVRHPQHHNRWRDVPTIDPYVIVEARKALGLVVQNLTDLSRIVEQARYEHARKKQ